MFTLGHYGGFISIALLVAGILFQVIAGILFAVTIFTVLSFYPKYSKSGENAPAEIAARVTPGAIWWKGIRNFIFIFVSVMLSIGVIIYISHGETYEESMNNFNSRQDNQSDYDNDYDNDYDFEWVEEPYLGEVTMWGTRVHGSLRNISNTTFSLVIIDFTLFDSQGNQIGTATATMSNLGAGNTWKFEAIDGTAKDTVSFEFADISYY